MIERSKKYPDVQKKTTTKLTILQEIQGLMRSRGEGHPSTGYLKGP